MCDFIVHNLLFFDFLHLILSWFLYQKRTPKSTYFISFPRAAAKPCPGLFILNPFRVLFLTIYSIQLILISFITQLRLFRAYLYLIINLKGQPYLGKFIVLGTLYLVHCTIKLKSNDSHPDRQHEFLY